MNGAGALSAGFADPVHDAQRAFRVALQALARPGTVMSIPAAMPGVALQPALAQLLLTLTDDETPVWWQQDDGTTPQWLRFHTSAPLAQSVQQAAFAVITQPALAPALHAFAAGSAASPEFSATLLIEVASLSGGPAMRWSGPGLAQPKDVAICGLACDFWTQWRVNHAAFPQGVDVLFCCGNAVLGLPRSTLVSAWEGN